MDDNIKTDNSNLVADWQSLLRIFVFTENEAAKATLLKYMEQILFGLQDFLEKHVGITEEISLNKLNSFYRDSKINCEPQKKLANVITDVIKNVTPYAVNVASPYFIGHMTSAIPFFMVHLKTIVSALNQNVVKLETSKIFSVIEKQVLAKIHRLIFNKDECFYQLHIQNANTSLGAFVEGGTAANYTALWVARNLAFTPKNGFRGVDKEGIAAAYKTYNVKRSVILVSRRAHFSLRKAAGLLGIGNENVIAINVDKENKIDLNRLKRAIHEIKQQGDIKIIAVVGIAGTTETGNIDPLRKIGKICTENKIHFHVDAAWGGPTLMSKKYKYLLDGIELASSVTIDGHKQFYMPMSCGMVYFNKPDYMDMITYHANYVNRPSSLDLGIKSIAGSREANSFILDCALKIMGSNGYALLIEHGIETAKKFAEEIEKREFFQLITCPELNILTYRICPPEYKNKLNKCNDKDQSIINKNLNTINQKVQRIQREAGLSFVSRTTIKTKYYIDDVIVFRTVIMNPLTNVKILNKILTEQQNIYKNISDNITKTH